MNQKILIIGESYFVGRVFTLLAVEENYDISIINRGRFCMKGLT